MPPIDYRRPAPKKKRPSTSTTRGPQGLPTQSTSTQAPTTLAPSGRSRPVADAEPTGVFAAPLSGKPFEQEKKKARRKARRKAQEVGDRSDIPVLPLLERYTRQQRKAIIKAGERYVESVKDSVRDADPGSSRGASNAQALYDLEVARESGTKRERQFLGQLKKASQRELDLSDAHLALKGIIDQAKDVKGPPSPELKGPPTPGPVLKPSDLAQMGRRQRRDMQGPQASPRGVFSTEGMSSEDAIQAKLDNYQRYMRKKYPSKGPAVDAAVNELLRALNPKDVYTVGGGGPKLFGLGGRSATVNAKGIEGSGEVLGATARIAKAIVVDTPRAYLEDPEQTLMNDLRFAKDVVAGAVKLGITALPGGAPADELFEEIMKQTVEGYKRRYGPAVSGDFAKYRKIVNEEGGLPSFLDAIPFGAAGAKTAGAAAKAGLAGSRAQRFVTRPRADMRETLGFTKRQRDETAKAAPNLFRVYTQRRRDEKRAKDFEKRDEKRLNAQPLVDQPAVGKRRLVQPDPDVELSAQGIERLTEAGGTVVRDKRGRVDRVEVPDNLSQNVRGRIDKSLTEAGFQARKNRGKMVYFARREVVHRERVGPLGLVPTFRAKERLAQRKDPAGVKGLAINSLREMGADARKAFNDAVNPLSREERAALMYATTGMVAVADPVRARGNLQRRRQQILDERDGGRLSPFQSDELRKVDFLIENAEKAFTPRLAGAVKSVREQIRVHERRNPTMGDEQRLLARYGPQAEFLGLKKGQRPAAVDSPAEAPGAALGSRENFIAGRAAADEADTPTVERLTTNIEETGPPGLRVEPERIRKKYRDGEFAGWGEVMPGTVVVTSRGADGKVQGAARLTLDENGVPDLVEIAVRSDLQGRGIGTELLKKAHDEGYDMARSLEKNAYTKQGAALTHKALTLSKTMEAAAAKKSSKADAVKSSKRDEGEMEEFEETASAFVKRVREIAKEEGLDTPAFVPSEKFMTPKFSNYAAGGTRFPAGPKRRTYAQQRQGVQRTDPEIVFEGIQRNIKAQHTANLVGDVYARHAHPRLRDMTPRQLKEAIEKEGFDVGQVAFWFPQKFRDATRGQPLEGDVEALPGDITGLGTNVHEAVKQSSITVNNLEDLEQLADEFQNTKGTVIPKSVHEEIFDTTKGDTTFGRGAERLKSLQSRAVLGTGNINWVITDTVANTFMAWFNGNVSPRQFVQSQPFFNRMPKELKEPLLQSLDVGRTRSQTYIPHMGGTVNTPWVNTWRSLRQTPVGADAKPLTKMLSMVMRAQPVRRGIDNFLLLENKIANDPSRRAVAYALLEKEAFRRIDERMGVLTGQIHRLQAMMGKSPRKQMEELLKDPRIVEEVGRGVDEMLGDFHTFTSLERRWIGRFLFFYPYARYATRIAFYTLPANHPVKMSIAARLGQFTEEQQRELLGIPRSQADEFRGLMFGRIFWKDKDSPMPGNLMEQNVRTANPLGNPLTESEGTESVFGMVAPWMQWLYGQAEKKDVFRGTKWNIGGESTGPYEDAPENLGDRAKILARQVIELPVITRELAKHRMPGEQSSEALPFEGVPLLGRYFGEVPMRYKTPERQQQANKRRRMDLEEDLWTQVVRSQFRLFVGEPSDIKNQIERRRGILELPTKSKGGSSSSGGGLVSVSP